jgi:hypothetical protein
VCARTSTAASPCCGRWWPGLILSPACGCVSFDCVVERGREGIRQRRKDKVTCGDVTWARGAPLP